MNLDVLHAYEDHIRTLIPKFKVAYKDSSTLQKVLGFLVRPFNPDYMTHFATTLSSTVYVPSQAWYEKNPQVSCHLLAHEAIHLYDAQKNPVGFNLGYAFPQALSVLPLLALLIAANWHAWPLLVLLGGLGLAYLLGMLAQWAFFAMAGVALAGSSVLMVLSSGALSSLFFGFLVLLAPWPAPWRVRIEERGYAMTLAFMQWVKKGSVTDETYRLLLTFFTGPPYFFMAWKGAPVEARLRDALVQAQSGVLQQDPPYGLTYEFLRTHDMLDP